jgi:hypothetical protein
LSEYAEIPYKRLEPFSLILSDKQHKIHLWGLGSWDADTKTHLMAYDKQLKDFTTMFGEESIL